MQVILTHEQGDFDALGSLLGASLLNEQAAPVLPRRLNRNVQAFMNLYGAGLPFTDPRHLPPGPIEAAILVDTQSLVTLKGMKNDIKVQVIDHHPPRPDLNPAWTLQHENVGACTTLFVEALREQGAFLAPLHATLLMLGIYEDTGSLSYASTTSRDLWAVIYLLEHGGSLKLVGEYLNQPLSSAQLELYDRLMSTIESHIIEGQRIMVACACAEDVHNEISSVAHKLRDMLDMDALFIIVQTSEGIRIVARSTSDQVDVARVSSHFGGGGHDRAAAALIDPQTPPFTDKPVRLEDVCAELIRILPRMVTPRITVEQLMSAKPMLLSPLTSAKEAASLMQKFGYEGYPVVTRGRVIGLLTRRAVDRALAHGLNLDAERLMEAGEITVQPQDSLEQLKQVMSDSGWGQVPVVNRDDGSVAGIVTRTDLLNTLVGGMASPTGRQNLATRLEAALPGARLALLQAVARLAHEKHMGIYIVGGFVRDLLLDMPSIDLDIVVEGDAIQLAQDLATRYGGRVVSHARFGTAKWQIDEIRAQLCKQLAGSGENKADDLPPSLDLISARTEFYEYPTALPTVKRSSIKLDLHRRDFTFNTLALRLDGSHYGDLHDYWGGLNDLNNGAVRVLHSLSFIDDPTRLLRAVRFEQRFGFSIGPRTRKLMEEAIPMVRQVSGSRLRHELDLILAEQHPVRALERLQELGLLRAIHPALIWQPDLKAPLEQTLFSPIDTIWELDAANNGAPLRNALCYLVWLSELNPTDGVEIANTLRLSARLRETIAGAARLWRDLPALPALPPSQAAARLELAAPIGRYALYCKQPPADQAAVLLQHTKKWRHIQPISDGNTLRALQIKPGPVYRQILTQLRSAWLDGKVSSRAEESALLEQLIAQYHNIEGTA
jgi:tRNA nucleotidyltransferase (CCA-adding enzyme)